MDTKNDSSSPAPAETSDSKAGRCAVATGSGQLTSGAKHYGFTTDGAATYIKSLLDSHAASEKGDSIENTPWEDLTGFDRACIAELLAYFRQNHKLSDAQRSL